MAIGATRRRLNRIMHRAAIAASLLSVLGFTFLRGFTSLDLLHWMTSHDVIRAIAASIVIVVGTLILRSLRLEDLPSFRSLIKLVACGAIAGASISVITIDFAINPRRSVVAAGRSEPSAEIPAIPDAPIVKGDHGMAALKEKPITVLLDRPSKTQFMAQLYAAPQKDQVERTIKIIIDQIADMLDGRDLYLRNVTLSDGMVYRNYYRFLIGPFESREAVRHFCNTINTKLNLVGKDACFQESSSQFIQPTVLLESRPVHGPI